MDRLVRFDQFETALYEANAVMNLTRVPREECWLRHFVDSLLFQDLIPTGSSVLDIGTGPGFPAWPLACARPDLQVTAIDSSGKMIGFLNKNPLPNLKTLQVRAEEWPVSERFGIVTGRAVAPLGIQLELSAQPCKVGGQILPMRTPAERKEVEQDFSMLGLELVEIYERALPGTDVVRLIPACRKIQPTPKRYPRTWAEIRRKPII
ncbi:MAG: 16S rRNA (guanine(527)-N(7))-methyltransferase RsmG [Fimbriimonadales bacterium]